MLRNKVERAVWDRELESQSQKAHIVAVVWQQPVKSAQDCEMVRSPHYYDVAVVVVATSAETAETADFAVAALELVANAGGLVVRAAAATARAPAAAAARAPAIVAAAGPVAAAFAPPAAASGRARGLGSV